jgi:anti-sigma regulatory factor (Ser/Thr protein kinase)
MNPHGTDLMTEPSKQLDELILGSQLTDMQRLPPWVETLGKTHGIEAETEFAINLCLEEVVSNVVRHGYHEVAGSQIRVLFRTSPTGMYVFTVEDHAPAFDPLATATPPLIGEQDPGQLGGQGIRLVRAFASSVAYEPMQGGNRLHLSFARAGHSASA